jgi:hypothetical protein
MTIQHIINLTIFLAFTSTLAAGIWLSAKANWKGKGIEEGEHNREPIPTGFDPDENYEQNQTP